MIFDIKIFFNAILNLTLNLTNIIRDGNFGTKYNKMLKFGIQRRVLSVNFCEFNKKLYYVKKKLAYQEVIITICVVFFIIG